MRILTTLNSICDAALALVYPIICASCESESVEARADVPACARCWSQTKIFTGDETICWKCGAPASIEIEEARRESVRCRKCDDEAFTTARACGLYERALRASVLRLKHEPHTGTRLVQLLAETQSRKPLDAATLLVPVPLHAERERARGFNQAALLARTLSKSNRLRCDESSLVRDVHTEKHRAGMDARARRETVKNAFRVMRPRLIEGEHILLIDDVFTTGATASACARALFNAGAKDVSVLTLARV